MKILSRFLSDLYVYPDNIIKSQNYILIASVSPTILCKDHGGEDVF